ncbi:MULTISPECIES: response regulator transcription factor [unclassified Rhizobium]|uniref:response regulator transcription factor n=1 Tax=unclassified Rhizobium TaxID=2613769 RepID=UPI002169EAA8|nr:MULTISPECIES: response regulator [unclassified Rhizobium]MCS3738097.1 FixJ family two-component response regulator [Rhizobium sp. BK661]MCS4092945.1 FixJ family two-component response regulator [Rhizobium sp. BK176]
MIYLVDDDASVREALVLLLSTYGKEVTAFPDAAHLLAHMDKAKPGILILDLRMPATSGLQLLKKLAEMSIAWPAIMITGHGDVEACRRAFKAGVADFLVKPIDEHVLIEAIASCEAQLAELLARQETAGLLDQLTAREREVMELVSKGLGSKDIATTLDVSVRTVDSHRASIAMKLGTPAVAEQTRIWLGVYR